MAKLDAISQAADYYINAIEAFKEEANPARFDVIQKIESGQLMNCIPRRMRQESTTGWYWQLQESLPEGPESRYLYHLLATHKFQEGTEELQGPATTCGATWTTGRAASTYSATCYRPARPPMKNGLPRVQASLAQADLEGMVARKLDFDARLNSIEESGDSLALATPRGICVVG